MTEGVELHLADEQTASDLRTYAGRAASLDRSAAIRLQVVGTVLAAYAPVLPGSGLLSQGLVLGLRTCRLAQPADLDVTVPVAGLLDRFAREAGTTLSVPPTQVAAPWAGQAPPRSGWELVGEVPGSDLTRAAEAGIAEIASATGSSAAALAVAELRRRVWARPVPTAAVAASSPSGQAPAGGPSSCPAVAATVADLPSGVAFAAHVLGFVGAAPAVVYRSGPWLRLSTPVGHVLTR
ncbi:hypothetical protein [Arsenicicoccus dermatophilus]|uniref:hypothetical protein n=1 Tax=Arsenicicoccus dermatophilus TaxID=1076331 RepID=UPI001F4D0467|nr:hypothetical protein [Arsenicicoccus dermatophilus]MCH8613409.1 hypothetical protein [Arsenicicoccus dermatophilus]